MYRVRPVPYYRGYTRIVYNQYRVNACNRICRYLISTSIHKFVDSYTMSATKGSGKRLSDSQRVDIIHKLQRINPPAKRALGREYNVTENSIRNVWLQRDSILTRTALMSNEAMKGKYRNTNCHHPELENTLYLWIDTMRRKNLAVAPSLVIHKAKQIATEMGISEDKFKGTWQWLKKFRLRKGLDTTMVGKGDKVNEEHSDNDTNADKYPHTSISPSCRSKTKKQSITERSCKQIRQSQSSDTNTNTNNNDTIDEVLVDNSDNNNEELVDHDNNAELGDHDNNIDELVDKDTNIDELVHKDTNIDELVDNDNNNDEMYDMINHKQIHEERKLSDELHQLAVKHGKKYLQQQQQQRKEYNQLLQGTAQTMSTNTTTDPTITVLVIDNDQHVHEIIVQKDDTDIDNTDEDGND